MTAMKGQISGARACACFERCSRLTIADVLGIACGILTNIIWWLRQAILSTCRCRTPCCTPCRRRRPQAPGCSPEVCPLRLPFKHLMVLVTGICSRCSLLVNTCEGLLCVVGMSNTLAPPDAVW